MGRRKKKGKGKYRENSIPQNKGRLHKEAGCALKIIQSHASVDGIVPPPRPVGHGGFEINFYMNVSLPSRAIRKGISETGVKLSEPVIFRFPPTYPFHAPIILLRPDFNRNLAHLNPISGLAEYDYVLPCVYDGPLEDLLHQEGDGLSEILNQLSDWLGKTAINDLINPKQN